ncbi:hypothetical protein QJS10_CPA03g01632 [Acorus calamus]|uniref:Plant-specific domain TIGR01615 family protein n=1 Tax=Acorus calamus TaxID=4465 RepID=A0AAV9FBP3_ACOCL|nr:hypothetical protein QJS10_CPA03g01632 [Acorus calamus]
MLLTEEIRARIEEPRTYIRRPIRLGTVGGGGEGECRAWAAAGGEIGGLSHESEHDLAVMVSDFLENGGSSGGGDSFCSSDSDSGLSDLAHLAERASAFKRKVDQYESDLLSVVRSLVLSINEMDLYFFKDGSCNASCIRWSLVRLLRSSGYDAAVCMSKWQGSGKVPGGDHEYIDVVVDGTSERFIIDIDFRSHFEIARAVESYDVILNSLPVVYVGSLARLKQFLQIMVEAARSSLKQNSMPVPPWRSLSYLQAKWLSSYERKLNLGEGSRRTNHSYNHKQCVGHLRTLKSSLQSEIESEHLLKPIMNDSKRRAKFEGWRPSPLRS